MQNQFTILTTYTGVKTIDEAVHNKNGLKLLWLEILFNDSIDWESYLEIPAIRTAYDKAAIWYSHFRNMVEQVKIRKPLRKTKGQWDQKEYRRFVEVLNFLGN